MLSNRGAPGQSFERKRTIAGSQSRKAPQRLNPPSTVSFHKWDNEAQSAEWDIRGSWPPLEPGQRAPALCSPQTVTLSWLYTHDS